MISWKRRVAGGLLSTLPLLAGPTLAQQQAQPPSEPPLQQPTQQPTQQGQPVQQPAQDQAAQPQQQPVQQPQQQAPQQPIQQQAPQQPPAQQVDLSNGHLDGLTASIALFPDALVSQILMAATYPDQVAQAAQWSKDHSGTTGDAAVKAVAGEPWDPSVQSLAAFPSVLDMMGRQPQWVEALGDAFLAAPDKVLDSVQRLRVQAQKAGNLKTTPQQKVSTQKVSTTAQDTKTVIVIEPANPQIVYVPTYNPTVVYGTWAYPTYPPVYYPPPPASPFFSGLVAGIGFGVGVAAVNSLWGGCNWGHGDVDINVNRYNNINPNRPINVNNNFNSNRQVNVNNNNFNGNRQTNVNNNNFNGNRQANVNNNTTTWQHNPANRGNTPYQDSGTRSKYDSSRQASLNNRQQPAGSVGNTQSRPQAGNNAQGRPQAANNAQGRTPAPNSRDAARERAAQSVENRTGVNTGHGAVDTRQSGNRAGQQGSGARGDGQQANGQRAGGQRADGQQGGGQRQGGQQNSGPRSGGQQASSQRGNAAGNTANNPSRTQQRPATSPQDRQRADTNAARTQSRQANQQSALRDAGNGNATRQQMQRIDRTPQGQGGGGGRDRGPAGRGRF
jgi:hypothetical protein